MRLSVIPIFFAEREVLLPHLCARLGTVFGGEVRVRPPDFNPESAYDASRGQYNSRKMLSLLLDGVHVPGERVLGVTDVDLFIPVLTYVFGEAQLDGVVALVSTRRLRAEVYGFPRDERLLRRRLLKESIHEIGHTYGLVHCENADCVMRSASVVEEVDLKSERFCVRCIKRVRASAAI